MKISIAPLLLVLLFRLPTALAEDISVRVHNLPPEGSLVLRVYSDPDTFADFRNPIREQRYTIRSGEEYVISGVPVGEVAVLAYIDENNNRALDKNFMGIPRESLGFSNNYQPKSPPSFQQAAVAVEPGQSNPVDIRLYELLGDSGQWGAGIGVFGRNSPYLDSDAEVAQVIPVVTYFGERLQWIGPALRYGVIGSDKLRLAVTATYRMGAYEEDDAEILEGLGDRDDTMFGGVALTYEGPAGTEFGLSYEHDLLDRFGGGIASASVSRGFQLGRLRLMPSLGVNWLNGNLANYDFGVPASAAIPGRPAYTLGSSYTIEASMGGMFELTERWRAALNVAVENLDSEITDSPIVDEDYVVTAFGALTYSF